MFISVIWLFCTAILLGSEKIYHLLQQELLVLQQELKNVCSTPQKYLINHPAIGVPPFIETPYTHVSSILTSQGHGKFYRCLAGNWEWVIPSKHGYQKSRRSTGGNSRIRFNGGTFVPSFRPYSGGVSSQAHRSCIWQVPPVQVPEMAIEPTMCRCFTQ